MTECGLDLAVSKAYHPQNCHVNIIHICVILEIESVIWEIKFRKSKVSFEKSNAIKFGNQKCYLRNQISEIKSVIWEIKRDKIWKSKVLFEKSNPINFGNQKCHLANQTPATNFGNQTCQILEIKNAFEKSNTTNLKSKWHNKNQKDFSFLLIIDKIPKS